MVPKASQVTRGVSVSIVLKADQLTGREVQGVVSQVLTRGDHPRGIKVRLIDGRIGRVQRLVTDTVSQMDGASSSDLNGTILAAEGSDINSANRAPGRQQHRIRDRDFRLDEHSEAPRDQIDLAAYMVAPKRKKGKKGAASQPAQENVAPDTSSSPQVSCPVCEVFKGDEAAVAHHVSEHFEA